MPDLKVTVKVTAPNRPFLDSETITYIQNDRRRVEVHRQSPQSLRPGRPGPVAYLPAPPIVTITRCDLDQTLVLNLDDGEYMSMPIPRPPSREALQARAAQQPKPAAQPQPNLLIETTTEDTGERKEMFGYAARHVVTTVKQIPLVESDQIPQETVTDGWYIDLDTTIPCDKMSYGTVAILTGSVRKPGEPPQIPILSFKNVGKRETGFALATTVTYRTTRPLPDGSKPPEGRITNEAQVTELSTGPLDAALFEVPKNFRKVPQVRRTPVVSYWMRSVGWFDYYWARLKRAI